MFPPKVYVKTFAYNSNSSAFFCQGDEFFGILPQTGGRMYHIKEKFTTKKSNK
jgi:hypothetical protein